MEKMYKAGEIARMAGITRSTLNYYVREGLLPRPKKTSRNMAYYPGYYVEIIRLIKELKDKRFLPLKVIKDIVRDAGEKVTYDEIYKLAEISGALFPPLENRMQRLDEKKLIKITGISKQDLRELEEHGFIKSTQDGRTRRYNPDDIIIVECLAALRKAGFTRRMGFDVSDVEIFKNYTEKIAQHVVSLFVKKLLMNVNSTRGVRMARDGIRLTSRLMEILYRKKIREISRLTQGVNGSDE